MRRPDSLHRLLSVWLIGPLLGLTIASAIPAYLTAASAAQNAYDSALLDPALAIASHLVIANDTVTVGLPNVALEALKVDTVDKVYFQVLGPHDEHVAGSAKIPLPDASLAKNVYGHTFYNSVVRGQRVRVAALNLPHRNGRILVQVAETFLKRDRLVRKILLSALLPEIAVVLVAIALFWLGIRRGLKPLEQLRQEIALRSPSDLHLVGDDDTPLEIKPLVATLNNLLVRLGRAIENQKRFIANAAHQLRTPLAGLATHAELARRNPDPQEMQSLLDMIAGETDRTSRLVNQLLTLARAEPSIGHASGHQPVNLCDIANVAAQSWVGRALSKNIDLGFELEDAWTLGDPLLLRELLANLIDNAITYTDPGGAVTVRTRVAENVALLEVEDNGIGIPQTERNRVFERFYRISGSRGEGSGLGLAIVAEIAARHGATVDISTPTSGRGTCVKVCFNLHHRAPASR